MSTPDAVAAAVEAAKSSPIVKAADAIGRALVPSCDRCGSEPCSCCPKCGGCGEVNGRPYDDGHGGTDYEVEGCDLCGGCGVWP